MSEAEQRRSDALERAREIGDRAAASLADMHERRHAGEEPVATPPPERRQIGPGGKWVERKTRRIERTIVTKHDAKGRVLEFEKEELEIPADALPAHLEQIPDRQRTVPAHKEITKASVEKQILKALDSYTGSLLQQIIKPALDRRAMTADLEVLRGENARLLTRILDLEGRDRHTDSTTVLDMRGRLGRSTA